MEPLRREIVELLPRLRRLARVLTHDIADADDLVQLTVERALTRLRQWVPGTRLDAWMFRIMKNVWIDETRSRARRARVILADDDGADVGSDAADQMHKRLEAAEVQRAMDRLPEDQRLAVALVLVEGLSYKEAAEVLEVPQGTLNSRLVRGRQALIAQFEGTG